MVWDDKLFEEVEGLAAILAILRIQIRVPVVVHNAEPLLERVEREVELVAATAPDAAHIPRRVELLVAVWVIMLD